MLRLMSGTTPILVPDRLARGDTSPSRPASTTPAATPAGWPCQDGFDAGPRHGGVDRPGIPGSYFRGPSSPRPRPRQVKAPAPPELQADLQAIGRPRYDTVAMLDEYLGEDLFGVRYLSAAQQAAFRLTVRDGLLLDARGERFDTTGSGTVVAGAGFAIFVMSARGAIFASRVHEDLVFHHSSLVAGQAVAAAGEIMVTDGILQHVTDRSGHYLPPPHLTAQFLRVMERRGVCLDAVVVESICSPHTDARSFSIHHGRVAAPGSDEDPRRQD